MTSLLRTLRASRPLLRPARIAPSTTRLSSTKSTAFQPGPSPPRLPAEEQAEFERLQREAEAALSSHTTISPTSASAAEGTTTTASASAATQTSTPESEETATATLSGGIRKGAPPEFVGEKNPRTGEVGGPKNEPLRWGSAGDWSYNGRVTDF